MGCDCKHASSEVYPELIPNNMIITFNSFGYICRLGQPSSFILKSLSSFPIMLLSSKKAFNMVKWFSTINLFSSRL